MKLALRILAVAALAVLLTIATGCKITRTKLASGSHTSYSLGTKTVVGSIEYVDPATGATLKVDSYSAENQQLREIVDAAIQAAVKSAAPAAGIPITP